jgi:superfamily II DNA or RNA helicase
MGAAKGKSLADYHVVRIPVALQEEEQAAYNAASQKIRGFMAAKRKEEKQYTWKSLLAEAGKDPEARAVQKAYYLKQSIEDRASEKLRVLEDVFRLHLGERILVFAGTNVMALEVSKRFLVPTLLNHSRKKERKDVLDGFAEGRFPVLVANQVLDEGMDVPEAKVAVVIGGQGSSRQAKQRLGRILRRSGSALATLYEVVCTDTTEVARSRTRRKSDAFEEAQQFRIAEGARLAYGRPRHRKL